MLRVARGLRRLITKTTPTLPPSLSLSLPTKPSLRLPELEYKGLVHASLGRLPHPDMLPAKNVRAYSSHRDKSRAETAERVKNLGSKMAIATGVATGVAGVYVAQDYQEAKTGTKKRGADNPLTPLDFLYVAIAKDENNRRKLGLIPASLFEAGQKAIASGKSPNKWFNEMLLVTPSATELPLYNEIAEYYFKHNHIAKAVQFWERSIQPVKMGPYYARAAAAYFEQKNTEQTASCLEKARKTGYQNYQIIMQLGHIYLTRPEIYHPTALKLFNEALKWKEENPVIHNRQTAITLNEMGVCIFMNALAFQDTKFKIHQISALILLERAASLLPEDPVIKMNLEIVKGLNETPVYGFPHRYLQCKVGEPTSMFEAIKQELLRYKTQTISELATRTGIGGTSIYDKEKNVSGVSPMVMPSSYCLKVPRHENILALNKLADIEAQHHLRHPAMASAPEVSLAARPTRP